MQAWQEASQAPLQSTTSAMQPVRPPNAGLIGEADRALLALPQSVSPQALSGDLRPAAPGARLLPVLQDPEDARLDPISSPQALAATEHLQKSAATPGSLRSADVRSGVLANAVPEAEASQQSAAPSWAQHASGFHVKSPLLGRRLGSTGADASMQSSPMSGQSTQDLIEGIESRYQQARAILRSYQR